MNQSSKFQIFKFLGPGILVTVGFIDPGNWAANIAAGSAYGYKLLWMVTLSTIMLIILQHNVAHLGIVTGKCLAESSATYLKPWLNTSILTTAVGAAIATALAEILGAAIALNMLFGINIKIGAIMILIAVSIMLFNSSYHLLEKIIIGFVALIALAFLIELLIIKIDWIAAAQGWVTPSFPHTSIPIIMSVLGAVVMPHNLFLHSEIVQSKHVYVKDEKTIKHRLKYEFLDTFFSMIVGWGINSAIIILAAATFYSIGTQVDSIEQSTVMLKPILGPFATVIFAVAFLFAGFSSSITAGMAGGSIFAGIFKKGYDHSPACTRTGILITLICATLVIFVITDPFKGLIYSQVLLSIQLPITIFLQIYLTASKKVMGKYANRFSTNIALWVIGITVTILNLVLLYYLITGE